MEPDSACVLFPGITPPCSACVFGCEADTQMAETTTVTLTASQLKAVIVAHGGGQSA
jgi:hypothetical protein